MVSFSLTSHAEVVIAERNIHLDWIKQVLNDPVKIETDDVDSDLHHSIGVIAEHGDRALRVVHTRALPTRIVTVYFDRSLKGKL